MEWWNGSSVDAHETWTEKANREWALSRNIGSRNQLELRPRHTWRRLDTTIK
jgi:hypothetical protein